MKYLSKLQTITHSLIAAIIFFTICFIIVFNYFFMTHSPAIMSEPNTTYLDTTKPIEERVNALLAQMTLEEKIGQMALVEKDSLKDINDIKKYHLGALLSGSGSKPEVNTLAGWKEMTDSYQEIAAESRLKIPLLYGSDAIHGHAHVPGITVFPHAIGLGASGNIELVKNIAKATAADLSATGVNWNFAPNLDTPQDIRWGRVYESFSDDPTLVAELGVAYLEGLQSAEGQPKQVLATAKHFLGLGGMTWGSSLNKNFKIDQGVTLPDETTLREVYLPPYKAIVDGGALSVMAGLNTWGKDRMVRQKSLLTDLLKAELGFKGFIVSDWYGVHEGTSNKFWATVRAVNAGIDMVMLPFDYEEFITHMKWANRLGLVSDARIDDAVSRILYTKFAVNLFDMSLSQAENTNHQKLARQAVAESLVLLKNNNVLPIRPGTRSIRVAGGAADNVGQQMGAWSVEWQGIDGNWPENATSILSGIKARAGTNVEYSQNGLFAAESTKADLGIAVVGEKPYAEGWGDNEQPTLSIEDLAAIKNLQDSSDKVLVIIVSGRPLLIAEEIDAFDALVAAWLPGSEGAGVADVIFGDKPFKGNLPLPWPRTLEQLPISPQGITADSTPLLFARGFGLKY